MRIVNLCIVALALFAGASAQCTLSPGDANTLNYALTLEHLEAAFYANLATAGNLTQAAFDAAGYPGAVRSYIVMIGDHENTHVNALTSTLTAAGCPAVPACAYNFGNATFNPVNFISTALALEGTGVAAYNGAIKTITDGTLRQVAATIATIEARHTAYLATLVNKSPFPNVTDPALDFQSVYALAGAFLANASACNLPTQTATVQCNYTGVFNTGFQTPSNTSGFCGISAGDQVTLNYALQLEYVEAEFYREAVASNFTFLNASQLNYIQIIAGHEAAHVAFIQSVFFCLRLQLLPALHLQLQFDVHQRLGIP